MLLICFAVNAAVSWFNAWSVGKAWAESKSAGGFARLLAWSGAVMAAVGFTWCLLVLLALGCDVFHVLKEREVVAMFNLGYVTIIVPALGSGLVITANSWAAYWRHRTLGAGAVATYNTFAQVYNAYQAVSLIPDALGDALDVLGGGGKKSSDKDSAVGALIVTLVVLAVAGGIILTAIIVRASARSHARAAVEGARPPSPFAHGRLAMRPRA